jgi:pyruvate/2-oxoglutarate dehydrogenase complex dihydrolipoamide acyltransferase (E2) component
VGGDVRIPIQMPQLGFDQESATIAGWLKQIGDVVQRGEGIAEIETEKVTAELPALDVGTLVEIVHDAGDVVAVGEVIGYLDDGPV